MGPLLRGMVAPIIVIMRANWFRFRLSFVSSAGVQSEFEGKGVASALPPMKGFVTFLVFICNENFCC